jgi:hypothetical protein
MDFSDKLAKAKAEQAERGRPTKTVTVSLDADVTKRLIELEAKRDVEMEKPDDGRLAKKSALTLILEQIAEVEAEYADTLVDLKFTRLEGTDWSDITIVNPPRPDAIADKVVFGYNVHAVTRRAAVESGVLIEDDGSERELTEEQWSDLFILLDGAGIDAVGNAIYQLNEGDSKRAVDLGKARRAAARASETKSS